MGSCSSGQNLESLFADVYEVPGEPAVVINGVPNLPINSLVCRYSTGNGEINNDPFFGELLVGREIRKLFGGKYYLGKVVKYDNKMNWYKVVYEDNDSEDFEWHELEDVLLPLDISAPLANMALTRFRYSVPLCNSETKIIKSRKRKVKTVGSKGLSVSNDSARDQRSSMLLKLENSNVTQGSVALRKLEIRRSPRLKEKASDSQDGIVKEMVLHSNTKPKRHDASNRQRVNQNEIHRGAQSGRKKSNTSSVEDVNAKCSSQVVVVTDCSGCLLEQENNNQTQGLVAVQKLGCGESYSEPKEKHSGLGMHRSKDAKAEVMIVESNGGMTRDHLSNEPKETRSFKERSFKETQEKGRTISTIPTEKVGSEDWVEAPVYISPSAPLKVENS